MKRAALAVVATLLASCSSAPESETTQTAARPNILFAIADDASFPHMGAYGTEWVRTPAFDRVARDGILFTNAYTPNAKCAPSRAAIVTGRNSWQLEAAGNHQAFFPPKFKSYVEALAENGYFVGKAGKGWGPGIAKDAAGNPRELAGTPFDDRKTEPPAQAMSNNDYASNFDDFLAAAPDDQPWAFWYGGYEPHRRYEYGAGVAKGGKSIDQIVRVPEFWPDNEVVRNDLLDYAYEIEYFDSHLGRILAALEQSGQLDDTLIVVTADNGMPFPRVKGQEYEMSNHLPLAAMWKNGIRNPGRTVEDYVSFIDFAPTFLDVAGIDWTASGMQPTPGRSLTDIFNADGGGQVNPNRDHVLIGKERHDIGRPHNQGYPIRGIVKGGMLYLRNYEPGRWPAGPPETGYPNTDGSPTKTEVLQSRTKDTPQPYWRLSFGPRPAEEFYDIREDAACMTNLADDLEYEARKLELAAQMTAELEAQGDPRMSGDGAVFETQYPVHDERFVDYYERAMRGETEPLGWINQSDVERIPADER